MPKPSVSDVKQYSDTIYNVAVNNKIPRTLALLIVAQSKHETDLFSSRVFSENKNAFGYKYVKGAKYQIGEGRTSTEGDAYAKYSSIEDSTREVVAWIFRRVNEKKFPALDTITTPAKYASLLKSAGYYGDPLTVYVSGLKRFLQTDIGKSGLATLITLIAITFLFASKIKNFG